MAFELQILGVGALLFSYGIYFLINKRYNGLQSYKKVPLIGLDGQEGKAQYTKSAISLVGEGYKKVCHMSILSALLAIDLRLPEVKR